MAVPLLSPGSSPKRHSSPRRSPKSGAAPASPSTPRASPTRKSRASPGSSPKSASTARGSPRSSSSSPETKAKPLRSPPASASPPRSPRRSPKVRPLHDPPSSSQRMYPRKAQENSKGKVEPRFMPSNRPKATNTLFDLSALGLTLMFEYSRAPTHPSVVAPRSALLVKKNRNKCSSDVKAHSETKVADVSNSFDVEPEPPVFKLGVLLVGLPSGTRMVRSSS